MTRESFHYTPCRARPPLHGRFGSCFWVVLAFAATVGCQSVDRNYIPSQVGPIPDQSREGPLLLTLRPSADTVAIGDVLYFTVTIKNIGERSIWIPRYPDILLTWIYPNGICDGVMRDPEDEKYFTAHNAILLHPHQELTRTLALKTYYFPKPGIAEFRAVMRIPRNTNPELAPFHAGVLISHAYGVQFVACGGGNRCRNASFRATAIDSHPAQL